MTEESREFERLRELFSRAVELPLEERRAFVAEESGGNPGLRLRLEAMLDEDAAGESLLDQGAAAVTSGMLAALETHACGPYRLGAVIGEGGMGVVYRARRDDLASEAAVKILRDAWVSPARRERFEREQRTLASLRHPGIAALLDAGVTAEGTPWIAMELVEGEQLVEHCRRKALGVEDRLALFLQVCAAVQYAHERAVIHRDLKPSNILVDRAGLPKLLDFGIAKRLEDTRREDDQTRVEFRMMTPRYAAPEQVRGEPAGVFTDVYALGVLLRELLDQAPGAAAWDELHVIAGKAAHADPAERYRGADALAGDVRRYLAGEPLEARPDSRAYRLRKFLARNRAGATAAASGLAVSLALAGYFTWQLKESRDRAVASAERARRIQTFLLNLFEGGDKAAGPAHGLTVETLIDRGVREAPALDRDPEVQAEVFDTLGRMYGRLGRYEDAGRLLTLAAGKSPSGEQAVKSLTELALLRSEEGKFDDAERLARQAMARQPGDAGAEEALGRILTERGRYGDAVKILERVLARRQRGSDGERLAAAASALASAHFYAGQYDESRRLNRQALAWRIGAHGERHPLVAGDLTNLGAIEFDTGQYAQGEPYLRRALELIEAWYGPSHPETGSALTMLGRDILYQGRPGEARPLLVRALAVQEKAMGGDHARVASVLNDLGNLATGAGEFDEAERYFQRMEEIYRRTRGDAHYLVATAMSNRGTVYLRRGEFTRAEQMFRDVVARYTKALSATHLNTAIARVRLGRSLTKQKRWREAVRETQAGYGLLQAQTQPAVSWLQGAREDLAAAYAALGQPEAAARYRREWDEAKKSR